MIRRIVLAAVLVAFGAAAASLFRSAPPTPQSNVSHPAERPGAVAPPRADVEQRLARLETQVARERGARERLQTQLDDALARLDALADDPAASDPVAAAPAEPAAPAPEPEPVRPEVHAETASSAMERALTAAGLDPDSAADIKQRHDTLVLNEMYLRDQATREQWLDTPRFAEEMAALDAERVSVREEIGDDAYDRYLFALGHPNRVRVDDVMLQSPAAQAGLQTGDMILQYGEARIFAPDELVAATRDGTAGETVRLEILRDGQRLSIDVPRGPLGLRIAGTSAGPPG